MVSRVMDPVFGLDGEPLDRRDPAWLVRFALAGMEAQFFFGPVQEIPASGLEAREAIRGRLRSI
jgi:hypothetical protein